MDYIQSLILYRASIVLGGIICIYFGYKLFYIVQTKQGELKVKTGGKVSLSLSDVGPGVFFALFGAAILIVSLTNSITITPMLPADKLSQNNFQPVILGQQRQDTPPKVPTVPGGVPAIPVPPDTRPVIIPVYGATAYLPDWGKSDKTLDAAKEADIYNAPWLLIPSDGSFSTGPKALINLATPPKSKPGESGPNTPQ